MASEKTILRSPVITKRSPRKVQSTPDQSFWFVATRSTSPATTWLLLDLPRTRTLQLETSGFLPRDPRHLRGFSRWSLDWTMHGGGAEPRHRISDPAYELSIAPDLAHAIENARKLTELPEDWDGEGSMPCSVGTWRRAASFLERYSTHMWNEKKTQISVPDMGIGPDASIDLHWETEKYELLINVPADESAKATFYGDAFGESYIEGHFDDTRLNRGLVDWLSEE